MLEYKQAIQKLMDRCSKHQAIQYLRQLQDIVYNDESLAMQQIVEQLRVLQEIEADIVKKSSN
jgi:hypothetical protein